MADNLPFLTPLETLAWAKEALSEFNLEARRFFQNDPISRVVEYNEETSQYIHKYVFDRKVPSALTRRTFDAVSYIKNSFDQSLFAACCVIGNPPKGSIYFPWADSVTDLDHRLRGAKSKPPKIPIELWPILRAFEPYPTGPNYTGGSDVVRGLAKIANRKHTVRLNVGGVGCQIQMACRYLVCTN